MSNKKSGSVFGGALLITGSCVGAGMLGLPILSGLAGLGPALIMFVVAWAFMTSTSLLLVEADSWFPKQVNLLSMVEHALGKWGKNLCLVTYLFLFYALLVAYVSASGGLFSSLIQNFYGVNFSPWMGSVLFVVLFGLVVYRGTRQVDLWNRVLMVGKIFFFLSLVLIGSRYVEPNLLTRSHFSLSFFALPILIVSFGFHNMVPSLTAYFHKDLKKVRKSIFIGGLFAFFIYILWEILVLGIVPLEGSHGLLESYRQDQEGSQALSSIIGSTWIQILAQGLAFFAILTSFLAQALSFVHFLADGFKISSEKKENGLLCFLALAPPLLLSVIYPKLFFKALDFAGGICAVLLFGIIPVFTVWVGRYHKKSSVSYKLPGGKGILLAILAFSISIFLFEVLILCDVFSVLRK